MTKEINEISKEKLSKYVKRAVSDHGMANFAKRQTTRPEEKKYYAKAEQKRHKGISMAINKLDNMKEANYNHGFGDDKPEKAYGLMPYKIHDQHKREFMHVYNTKLGGNKTSHARSLAYNHAIRHIGDKHGNEVKSAFEKYYKHSTLNGHTNEEEINMSEEILDEATRKHFRAAAETIKAIEDPEKRKEHASIHADIYAKQNPRFDRSKFMKAAGVNEDEEYDDDEIEDIEDEEISSAEEIVNSAVFENPVGVKDAFTAALGDRIATRIGEIADDMKNRVFASNESYIEEDDEIDEGHSRHQLSQAAAYHRSRERGYAKNVRDDNISGGAGKKSDLRNYRRHRDAASAAYKLMGKLDDSGKGHTSQLRKEDREDYRGQSTHLTDKDFKRIKKDYGKKPKPTQKED